MQVGQLVSVLTKDNIRLEGLFRKVDKSAGTLEISDAILFGTEDRPLQPGQNPVAYADQIFPVYSISRANLASCSNKGNRTPAPNTQNQQKVLELDRTARNNDESTQQSQQSSNNDSNENNNDENTSNDQNNENDQKKCSTCRK